MRQRLISLFIVLVALIAVAAADTSTAAAEAPEILSGTPIAFTDTSGVAKLVSPAGTIECKKKSGSGEFTGVRTGTLTNDFSECASAGVNCKSTGDATGTVLLSSILHLVAALISGVLVLDIAATVAPIAMKCGTLSVEITGTAIGKVEGITSGVEVPAGTSKNLVFAESGSKQAIKTCEVDKAFCEGKVFELLAEFGTGKKEGVLITTNKITWAKVFKVLF